MQVRSLGLRTDLTIRELSGSTIEDRGDVIAVHTPSNPTFRWGNFLLFPAPIAAGEAAQWEAAFTAEFPDAAHRAFAIDGVDGRAGDRDEIDRLGVRLDVSTVLTASARQVPAPAGTVACRALVSDSDWEQSLGLRLACFGSDEPEFTQRRTDETRALTLDGHAAWFGAFAGEVLAAELGIVSDGSGLARYQDVETHPDYRRRGFARELLTHAARFAADAFTAETLVIVADPDYHAIELYRSAGFRATEQIVQLEASGTAGE